jgi:hypothetical protein
MERPTYPMAAVPDGTDLPGCSGPSDSGGAIYAAAGPLPQRILAGATAHAGGSGSPLLAKDGGEVRVLSRPLHGQWWAAAVLLESAACPAEAWSRAAC